MTNYDKMFLAIVIPLLPVGFILEVFNFLTFKKYERQIGKICDTMIVWWGERVKFFLA